MASMKDCIFITLMAFLLTSCGGGSGGNSDWHLGNPFHERYGHLDPESLGFWASFSQGHFRVEETMLTDSGSTWLVHGTPTGLVDNLPRNSEPPSVFRYTGHVWGRVYGSRVQGEFNRVVGQMDASYGSRDHYGPGADDVLNVFLSQMWRELPDGGRDHLPGMIFRGDVGTNRTDPDYDPLQDTATFTLSPEQYEISPGEERGEATGNFYGPNGEALAATFWYTRDGYRIQGVFGGKLGE